MVSGRANETINYCVMQKYIIDISANKNIQYYIT